MRSSGCGCLHKAIVDREEQGETLSRLLPGGLAEKLRRDGRQIGETERVVVTVLMSDIRSYSTIAEHADPSQLAGQLNVHRAAMNDAILGENGTVMQFVGDAVMAVFGAPFDQEDHADRAVVAALAMHEKQSAINAAGTRRVCPRSASAWASRPARRPRPCSGSEERLEYTLVGDTVNMSQRLQQLADAGETVVSQGTVDAWEVARRDGRPAAPTGQGTRDARARIQTGGRRTPTRRRPGERRRLTWTPWSSTRSARPSRRRTHRCGRCAAPTSSSRRGTSSR